MGVADVSTLRLLKCRLFGQLGACDKTKYFEDTGRMLPYHEISEGEAEFPVEEEEEF